MKRRIVAVRISPDLVESWLKSTGDECVFYSVDGVPSDSQMIDLRYDFQEGLCYALFSHDSFNEVPLGVKIPVVTPRITTYYI